MRRVQRGVEARHTVRRGEDKSFGLGLSEDNEIIQFYHDENAGVLRIGDQVRAVDDTPLVRERLAHLLARKFGDRETVELHISRTMGESGKHTGDVFATLELRDSQGEELDEWTSEIFELRGSNATWGTFWTLPILPGVQTAWLGVHESKMFSEPLIGCLELKLDSLAAETLTTSWHSLRGEDDSFGRHPEIEGEVLLTVRKFYSAVSISPDGELDDYDSAEEPDPSVPIDHATQPLKPIPEP